MVEEVKRDETFEITRQNLGELALDAALEIERAIAGMPEEQATIVRFVAAISSSLTPKHAVGSTLQHFIDPVVVPLYTRAANTVSDHSLSTVQELLNWITQFDGPKGKREAFRDFVWQYIAS